MKLFSCWKLKSDITKEASEDDKVKKLKKQKGTISNMRKVSSKRKYNEGFTPNEENIENNQKRRKYANISVLQNDIRKFLVSRTAQLPEILKIGTAKLPTVTPAPPHAINLAVNIDSNKSQKLKLRNGSL